MMIESPKDVTREVNMLFLFGILIFGLLIGSLILPWIQHRRIQSLDIKVDRLMHQIAWLLSNAQAKGTKIPDQWETLKEALPKTESHQEAKIISPPLQHLVSPSSPPRKKASFKKIKTGFEQTFVVNLPVWIGGIAIALAGFFLVNIFN